MTMENKNIILSVNTFVIRDGMVLLGRRKGKVGEGMWALPGGKLAFWEKMSDCAKRELLEETGLAAKGVKFLQLVNDIRGEDGTHCIHIQFLAEGVEGEPKLMEPDKGHEWGWFPLDDWPRDLFFAHEKFFPALKNEVVVVDVDEVLLERID